MSFVYYPSALGNKNYHQANTCFISWVKQDGETEVFCALIGVNYQIMQVNLCGKGYLSVCLILVHAQKMEGNDKDGLWREGERLKGHKSEDRGMKVKQLTSEYPKPLKDLTPCSVGVRGGSEAEGLHTSG